MPLQVPDGEHAVSTLTLELPVHGAGVTIQPDRWRFKNINPPKPAFELKTVLFTIFYPTDRPEKSAPPQYKSGTLSWLNGPKLKGIQGLLKYAGINRYAAIPAILPAYQVLLAKLPYAQNAPLLNGEAPLPVAIFSHGLGGTANTYSSYLSSLASTGIVAVAIEHRDGTCPHTSIFQDEKKEESLMYVKEDEVKINEDDEEKWAFRRAQLEFRRAEIKEVIRYLDDIRTGQGEHVLNACTRTIAQPPPDLKQWQDRLEDKFSAIGHSFGGATMLSVLTSTNVASRFTSAILLDPWLEPLPHTVDSQPPQLTTLIINSQAFTVWKSHFDRLRGIASATNGHARLYTLTGSKHVDFSDMPSLMPRLFGSSVKPQRAMEIFTAYSSKIVSEDAEVTVDDLTTRAEREGEIQSKDMGEAGVLVEHPLA